MDTTKYIQLLAKLYLGLLVLYIFSTFMLQDYLPQELRGFLEAEIEREPTQIEDIAFVPIVTLVILHIASLIGFIRTKIWSAKYFVYTTIGLAVGSLFMGPYVDHAVAATISSVSVSIAGAIIAMLYTTKSAFNPQFKNDATSSVL
ncbi:hypothetical protein [Enterovibrio norvegicus]|nr:hypothetical protein [Enterovibrio norvegicus]